MVGFAANVHAEDLYSLSDEEIDRRFKEAGIEIAFPQQDLHIRSMPDPTDLYPPLAGKGKEGE